MCEKSVKEWTSVFKFVSDQCKTQNMRDIAVEICLCALNHVLDECKMREMCEKGFEREPYVLEHLPSG